MKTSASRYLPIFLLCFFIYCTSACQTSVVRYDSLCHYQLVSDTLYDSPQNINLLYIHKKSLPEYKMAFAYESDTLIGTSSFAEEHGALAAINGSFFDMDKGGNVSYFEINDSVINSTRAPGFKWAVNDSILNAALILYKDNTLAIEAAMPESFYEESDNEAFVMVSGPLMIKNSLPQELPDMNFTHMRHPRTCIGITGESIIFITIDGRSEQAAGMNLLELQEFLLSLGCLEAINLDGGGSTTMWIKDQGIVNKPSDRTGERPVANALLILQN